MKRLLMIMIALLVLVGCSSAPTEPTEVKKACSLSQEGMALTIEATAPSEEGTVSSIVISCDAKFSAMGITADMLTDEMKEQVSDLVETMMLSSLGQSSENVTITQNEFTDEGLLLAIELDVAAIAEAQGVDPAELTLDSFITSMSDSGFTCE